LVVGATGGIGRAVTAELVAAGSRVVAAGRDPRMLEGLRLTFGVETLAVELGTPDRERVQPPPGGEWNLVVLCAGVGHSAPVAAHTDADLDRLFEVNTAAQIRLLRDLLPSLALPPAPRRLAIVGSIAGILGVGGESGYAASKAALMIFADSLRIELAAAGVGVTVLVPGVVHTGFFQRRGVPYQRRFPRAIEPERVARALVGGVRHDRAEVVVPGWLRLPIALRACVPAAYWRLARRWA
jgi:short-subunit dehydrogenase